MLGSVNYLRAFKNKDIDNSNAVFHLVKNNHAIVVYNKKEQHTQVANPLY